MTMEQAKATVDTLQYQDNILCTKDGHMYRIASIVDNSFDDKAAINVENRNYLLSDDDTLNMGFFFVQPRTSGEAIKQDSKLMQMDQNFKILLFLCKTPRERGYLHAAGFCIVGTYLCWSYPRE